MYKRMIHPSIYACVLWSAHEIDDFLTVGIPFILCSDVVMCTEHYYHHHVHQTLKYSIHYHNNGCCFCCCCCRKNWGALINFADLRWNENKNFGKHPKRFVYIGQYAVSPMFWRTMRNFYQNREVQIFNSSKQGVIKCKLFWRLCNSTLHYTAPSIIHLGLLLNMK